MRFEPFVRSARVLWEKVADRDVYPFSLPAIRAWNELELAPITYLVGENGSGKSTMLEALAVAAGFNAEGGSRHFDFSTRASESELHRALRLSRGFRRPATGYFLRAETFYNVATEVERLDAADGYGPDALHELSHGESFLALIKHRFRPNGFYVLDEPEAALSPARQLALLRRIHDLLRAGSQFVIATHAPIVLAYPNARIYRLGDRGIEQVDYEDTEQVALTRDFLLDRSRFLSELFEDP